MGAILGHVLTHHEASVPKVDLYFHEIIITSVATSIGVQESTRDRLERVKRDLGAPSLDATIARLLEEHAGLGRREASARFLAAAARKRDELRRWCRTNGVRRLSVFGSALHGEAHEGSDLDLLVEFLPGKTPGLLGLGALERGLTELLGVPVDLQTPGSLSTHIRDEVLGEAWPLLGAA